MNIINKETEYAFLIIDFLSKFSKNKIISSKEISIELYISPNIILKLLRNLTKKKKDGDYILMKKDSNYSEIIELI